MTLRIAHVTSVFSGTGGIENLVRQISGGLARRGHDVTVLVAGAETDDQPLQGVDVRHFPTKPLLGRYRVPTGLPGHLLRHAADFDIVHAHQGFAVATQVTAMLRTPTVITLYQHPLTGGPVQSRRRRAHLRLLLGRFDSIVFVSRAEQDLVEGLVGRKLPHGTICRPGYSSASSDAVPLHRPRPVILCVGRLVAHKRVDTVLRVARRLADVADLIVIGDGPERLKLRDLAVSLGLDADACIKGFLPDDAVASWMRSADIFISLSTEEAFGISVLEAAAAGAQLLVTDLPSHREIVELAQGTEDNLVPVRSTVDDIEASARRLLTRAGERHPIAGLPTWEEAVDDHERLYEQLRVAGR